MTLTTMNPHDKPRPSLLDPADQATLRVLEYDWRRMSGMDQVPAYAEFKPAELDAALPHAFVLQRVAPGVGRIRVAGQRLHELMRMDPRGMPFAAFFSEDSRETAMSVLEHAFQSPAIIGLSLSASRGLGRKPVRAEALLLPMRDSDGQLTRLMGAIVTSGPLPARPLRFDIAKGQPLRCDMLHGGPLERRAFRGRAAKPVVKPQMPSVPPAPRSPARQAPTDPVAVTPRQPSSRPHLRLVVDNTA